jgi:hypothetical protein
MFGQDWQPHFEVGAFGGGQFWKLNRPKDYPLDRRLGPGGLFGGRLGYDFNPRWGLETSLQYGSSEAGFELRPNAGAPRLDFSARNLQWMVGPIYYLGKSSSRFRPFLTAGPALQRFWPTKDAEREAVGLSRLPLGPVRLDDNYTGAVFYGGGFKAWLSRNWHARFDLRGITSGNPHIRYFSQHAVPDPLALPSGAVGHALQATFGLGYAIGSPGYDDGSPAGPSGLAVKVTGPDREVYQGDPANFMGSAQAPKGNVATLSWRVDGQPAGTGDSITVDTSKMAPGKYPVEVTASAPKLPNATDTATLTVIPRPPKDMKLTLTGPDGRIYPGDPAVYSVRSDAPAGTPLKFEWKVDGQPAPVGDKLELDTRSLSPGDHRIEVTGSADGFKTATDSATLAIARPNPPQISISAPPQVNAGDRAPITTNVTRGEGGGNPGQVRLSASDGRIANGELDTSSVSFDPSAAGEQRKPVTVTANVTDDKGLSASANTTVTVVKRPPPATRLADVVFPRNNSRVNNCGKRVLLEELKAYIDRDPTGRVILVAHLDKGELRTVTSRRARNAAAVITGGSGICLGIDPNRVFLGLAGADQANAPMPYLCGTSTRAKTTERRGSAVRSGDDRAQYRRVEVWFVPTGSEMPAGLGELKTAAEHNVKTLGCPK